MYKLLFTILLLLTYAPENQLAWDANYRLSWSDFKGEPQEKVDAVAITASGLSSSFSARTTSTALVDYKASVIAHFYPDKSWYKPGKVNEIVLAHEQLHFDITELNARKLRKNITDSNFTIDIKSEMNHLVDQANKDLEVMQELYDSQSDFSMDVGSQKKWQLYISEELERLSNYK